MYLLILRQGLSSLCCPGTVYVVQDGLKLRDPPASASQALGLKALNLIFPFVLVIFLLLWLKHRDQGNF